MQGVSGAIVAQSLVVSEDRRVQRPANPRSFHTQHWLATHRLAAVLRGAVILRLHPCAEVPGHETMAGKRFVQRWKFLQGASHVSR